MKIINLKAENIKRLVAVDITPDSDVVEITGRNGAGKSSVLDAIWWAIAGARTHQAVPVRQGEEEARITLDLGDIIVRRIFRVRDDETSETTTQLTVESADGARYPSPQRMLDDMVGSLAFDPIAFFRSTPAEQLAVLRGFVSGVDFDEAARMDAADYAARRDANRRAKAEEALAASTEVPEPDGDAPDMGALVEALEHVRQHNRLQADRVAAIEAAEKRVEAAEKRVQAARNALAKAEQAAAAALDAVAELHAPEDMLDEDAARQAYVDGEMLREQHAARDRALTRRREAETRAEAAKFEAQALTDSLAARKAEMVAAVAAAEMPVAGLSLDASGALLHGLPLDQASDAEQLRLSAAVAMAGAGKLRVMRIRDGSLLDDDGMALLRELAAEHDCQVWIERVDTSGVGVLIEDGRLGGGGS